MAGKSEAAFESLMGETTTPGTEEKVLTPEGPSEVERTIQARRLQRFFRNSILANYENCCALTGIAVPQLLVASHIIPWSKDERRRADPTNGICLNSLHDKAFDRHLITFDEDYRLVVSSTLKKKDSPEIQASNFSSLEGKRLMLPHRFAPDIHALEEHRKSFIS